MTIRFLFSDRALRPYLWGFFVSVALFLLIVLGRTGCSYAIENRWISDTSERSKELVERIGSRFAHRAAEQFKVAREVARDQELLRMLATDDAPTRASAFGRLETYRRQDDVTIDVVDSLGRILAWSGRSVVPDYKSIIPVRPVDSLVVIPRANLHRYLSAGLATDDHRYYILVNRPLEVNYPISNRFITRTSFSEELSKDLGISVQLVFEPPARDMGSGEDLAVPLTGSSGQPIAFAIARAPSVSGELQSLNRIADQWESVVVAVGSVFLAFVVSRARRSMKMRAVRFLVLTTALWGVRLMWREFGFPSTLISGPLFDPAVYASPFILGLASSLGELLVSCFVLFATGLLLLREVVDWREGERGTGPTSLLRKVLAAILIVVVALAFQWLIRGFGAAIRSFVYDSTLRFLDPSSLVPDVSVVIMYVNILLLTLALLLVCAAAVFAMERWVVMVVRRAEGSPFLALLLFAILTAAYGAYLAVNRVPQTPFLYPPLAFLLVILLALSSNYRRFVELVGREGLFRHALMWGSAAFVLAAIPLDMWQQEKEHQRVQVMADELLRPVDSWLSYVISDGLRTAGTSASEEIIRSNGDSTRVANLAFALWAQTLMSREGYNSAVFVYDRQGKELSRFSVGLTTYEQMELLSQIFDTEEEVLHVVERKVPGGNVKYYGEWGSVLDTNGRHLGTVALMASASQRALFRGEAPEPLRATSRERFDETLRKISISEYQGGVLVSTTEPLLSRGMRLPEGVLEEMAASQNRSVWSSQELEGESYDVLYARDESLEGRVLAISVQPLDVRWYVFNLVKMLSLYVLIFGGTIMIVLAWSALQRGTFKLGFREKLVSSFAVLSVLPLLFMAYYNRELAIERLDENLTRRLAQDLEVIHQRIVNSVVDEEDFANGVNNDYCEVAAADLGVDFSVFSGQALQASSRPELYRYAILDSRPPGSAYVNTVVLGKGYFRDFEEIGEVRYMVGYRPIIVQDRIVGALAVPALYRQQEIDEELAQRNAFVLGAYALVLVLVVAVGFVLANRLSRPLRELSRAARTIGKGNLDIQLEEQSADEVGDLVRSFNEMTRELKANRDHLARAERELAWKEMAKQVAHEIKNPLTPIKLSIQHLLQAHKDGAKDFAQILQRVSKTVIEQIETLSRIASEFSNFARMPERRFERVDIKQLLQETVTLFGDVRGIDFRTKFAETPAVVIADKDELRRVFINVMRNSIQAMEQGGMIEIRMEVAGRVCTIAIRDTGGGIPPDVQARVFQPNFSTKTDGMGLGLAIAQKAIEDLNGTILLRSEVGKGTTVEMKIPLQLG